MSHQPFETWLFSDEPMEPDQSEALKNHLDQCDSCSQMSTALNQVYEVMSTSHTPEPAPGFTQRWYQSLSIYRQKRNERRIWFAILGLFSLAILILLSLFFVNLGRFSWLYNFGQFIANFSLAAAKGRQIIHVFRSITDAFPILIPIMAIFGVGSLSAIMALIIAWFSSIIRIYQPVETRGYLK